MSRAGGQAGRREGWRERWQTPLRVGGHCRPPGSSRLGRAGGARSVPRREDPRQRGAVLGSFIQQHREQRDGPFVCDARSGRGRIPPRLPPAGPRERRREVMGALPLKGSYLYRYLSRFSTSGDKQENGAHPRMLSEFRFLND